jgi:uncharacterized protein (DUF58 family)
VEPPLKGAWRPTAPLVRSVATAAVLALAALVLGSADLLVLAVPFGLMAALGLAHAPRGPLTGRVRVADRWLHEGQTTRLQILVEGPQALEQVSATLAPPAYVVAQPPAGALSCTPRPTDDPGEVEAGVEFAVSSRRWGVRTAGTVAVAASTPWCGYRWGPQRLPDATLVTLPETGRFASAESPHPVGLIGQNRSRRSGDGSEFFGIRPFQPGDRLRRVNWRTTLRTGEVHAIGTSAQEDSAVMILVDAVTDVGASGGIDGAASSLDVTVRAASALAAHYVRVGDRVALRVLGRTGQVLGPGSGLRHQRRLQELLAQVQPGWPEQLGTRELRLRTGAGTIVVVLSPLLTPEITTVMVTLARRGLSVVCVDTLGEGTLPQPARDQRSAARLAWRMRMLEREMQITEVTRRGIPVVTWRGPGTLDEVLRGLARRARLPRTPSR